MNSEMKREIAARVCDSQVKFAAEMITKAIQGYVNAEKEIYREENPEDPDLNEFDPDWDPWLYYSGRGLEFYSEPGEEGLRVVEPLDKVRNDRHDTWKTTADKVYKMYRVETNEEIRKDLFSLYQELCKLRTDFLITVKKNRNCESN